MRKAAPMLTLPTRNERTASRGLEENESNSTPATGLCSDWSDDLPPTGKGMTRTLTLAASQIFDPSRSATLPRVLSATESDGNRANARLVLAQLVAFRRKNVLGLRISRVKYHTMDTSPDTLISLRSVATRLNLSIRAVYRLVARGLLPRPVKVGGATRFFESDIAQYLESLRSQRR